MKCTPDNFFSSPAQVQSRLNCNSVCPAMPQAHDQVSAWWLPDTSPCSCCFGGTRPNAAPQTLCLRLFSIFFHHLRRSPSYTWRNLTPHVILAQAFRLWPRFRQLPSQQLSSSTGPTQKLELPKLGTPNVSKSKFDPVLSDWIPSNPIQMCEKFACIIATCYLPTLNS